MKHDNSERLEIFLDNDKKERIFITSDEFLYELKDEYSKYNSKVIRVTPLHVSFYNTKKLDNNTYCTNQFKFDKNFTYLKESNTISYDKTISKLDVYIVEKNGSDFLREVFRLYEDGKLVESDVSFIPLTLSREEYIKKQIEINNDIKFLHKYIEDYSSDLLSIISDINPDYNYLIDVFSNDKNKIYIK